MVSGMEDRRRQPLIMVELMRFACALAVMGCHYGVGFWVSPGERTRTLLPLVTYAAPGRDVLTFGWLGVELFFVVSGMMIARSAVGVAAPEFLRRRAIRLAPAAWACGAITVAAVTLAGGADAGLLASWTRSTVFWPTGQQVDASYWTLGIECAFYLLVAGTLGGGGRPRRIEGIAYALAAASASFWIGCTLAGPEASLLYASRPFQLLLLPHGCFFALGILLSRIQADGLTPMRGGAIALALAAAAIEITVHATESRNETGLATPVAAALAMFGLGVAALAAAERWQDALARRIGPALARTIGLTTYPLYLVHQDAGAAIVGLLAGAGVGTGASLLVAAGATLVMAWAVARFAEPLIARRLAAGLAGLSSRDPARDRPPTASPRAG